MAKKATKTKLSEGDILTIKNYLKSAKEDFTKSRYKDCIEWCDYIIDIDEKNYFATLLKGKCFGILGKYDSASTMFFLNIEYDEENILGYKGLWELLTKFLNNNMNNKKVLENFENDFFSYKKLFSFLLSFYKLNRSRGDNMVNNDIIVFIQEFKTKVPESEKELLSRYVVSDDENSFYYNIGKRVYSQLDGLLKALKFKLHEEKSQRLKYKSMLRMTSSDRNKIELELYNMFQNSRVEKLYEQIINTILSMNDSTDPKKLQLQEEDRYGYEEDFLLYKVEKVTAYPRDLKEEYFQKNILDPLSDLVYLAKEKIYRKSFQLYLDWYDVGEISIQNDDYISQHILAYIKRFPSDDLSIFLYAYLSSNHSLFNFFKEDLASIRDVIDPSLSVETEEECYGLMFDCMEKLKESSFLALRLAVSYLVTTENYETALPYIEKGILKCKYIYDEYGYNMFNSRFAFSLDLAMVYTHIDPPKYHSLALKLYDQYLLEDPSNLKAKLNKSLILIDREQFSEASKLIEECLEVNPDHYTALEKYAYCQSQVGNYSVALSCIDNILKNKELKSQDLAEIHFLKASVYLKKYESLIEKQKVLDDKDEELLDVCYENLIASIKLNEFSSKAFQLLGCIYNKYFDDAARAFKCYWKAFYLNNGDILSAYYIVDKLCATKEWKLAASICRDLIDSGLVKRQLQTENWPYRVLGIYNLDIGQIDESIDSLQNSIRINSSDVHSLIPLGQGYLECGKPEAALKVFTRVLELDPSNEYGKFFYAIVMTKLGNFVDAEDIFTNLCFEDEDIEFKDCYLLEYINHLAEYSNYLSQHGFISKSCLKASKLIECVHIAIKDLKCSHFNSIWIALNVALKTFLGIGSKHDDLPIETLIDIFESSESLQIEIDLLKDHPVALSDLLDNENESSALTTRSIISKCLILASKCSFVAENYETQTRAMKASLWYNLGTSELTSYFATDNIAYRDAALLAFQRSIKLQSNVTETWIGMGVATMDLNLRVSQHCLIKALSMSPKEPVIYNNLAMLALKNSDTEFAKILFQKSQSMFPSNYFSWFGLALSNNINGNNEVALKYFKHSFLLSNGKNGFLTVYYAMAVLQENFGGFNKQIKNNIVTLQEFIFTVKSIEIYLMKNPHDVVAIESLLLLLERVEIFDTAITYAEKLIHNFENLPDMNNETILSIMRLTSQYARLLLAKGHFERAIKEAQSSESLYELVSVVPEEIKLSNDSVVGLVHFFTGKTEEALNILMMHKIDSVMEFSYKIMFKEHMDIKFDNWDNKKLVKLYSAITLVKQYQSSSLSDKTSLVRLIKKLNDILEIDSEEQDGDYLELLLKLYDVLKLNKQNLIQRTLYMNPDNLKVWEEVDSNIGFRLMNCKPLQVPSPEEKSDILIKTKQVSKIQRAMFLTPWKSEVGLALVETFK